MQQMIKWNLSKIGIGIAAPTICAINWIRIEKVPNTSIGINEMTRQRMYGVMKPNAHINS